MQAGESVSLLVGDILLFKGESGISKLIAWGTNSTYSHVAVCVSPEMNLAIEALTRGGVRARGKFINSLKPDAWRKKLTSPMTPR